MGYTAPRHGGHPAEKHLETGLGAAIPRVGEAASAVSQTLRPDHAGEQFLQESGLPPGGGTANPPARNCLPPSSQKKQK